MMREYDIQRLMDDKVFLEDKIRKFIAERHLLRQNMDKEEIKGHILKADHNLRFVDMVSGEQFLDWTLTGCYYACYHAALALIQTRGYSSKNHLATLCIMIKEFYRKGLTEENIRIFSNMLDYEDILFYAEAKNKREDASYSTRTAYDKQDVQKVRLQAIIFVNRIKDMITDYSTANTKS